jgi:hypothetical protein
MRGTRTRGHWRRERSTDTGRTAGIARAGGLTRFLSSLLLRVLRTAQCWRDGVPARSGALRIRRYRPGDERGILRLFRSTFRQRKSLSRWRWEFLESPYGKTNITLLVSDTTGIVGHYGGIVIRFNYEGAVIPAAQIVDVMIHPACRGRAAVERLVHACAETSRNDGIKFLYGFNETVVARSNQRFFGAALVPVSEWVHDIARSRAGCEPIEDDPVVRPVARLDDQGDALWERLRGRYPYAVVRDGRYLNWRYSRRSDRKYVLWQAANPSSGQIVGLAVLGGTRSDGLILELLTDPHDARSIAALVRASIAHFSRERKRRVRAWFPPGGSLPRCAQATGFRAAEVRFYLNLLPLDGSLDVAALTTGFYYSLGDYDVY